ncbi:MAG: beta-xylosidase, partial [Bryobacterales bacterium]|nr:beta-xylosidase [Bryobacterales bacterium]
NSINAMIWNYHDDDVSSEPAGIALSVGGVPATAKRVLLRHYRIDQQHSNAYTLWKEMGSPQQPTPQQYAALEAAGQLKMLGSPAWVTPAKGIVEAKFALPRQGVSLVQITW